MALPIIVASAVPVILKGVAITTGAIGLGVGIKSGLGMKKSNDTLKEINERHEKIENIIKLSKDIIAKF